MTTADLLVDTPIDLDHDGLGYRGMRLRELLSRDLPTEIVLGAVKAHLHSRVDDLAEGFRARIVTPGAGQAMEYQEAQAQASTALALPKSKPPSPGDFPMLDATIGVDIDPASGEPATDVLGVARSVRAAYDGWLGIGAAIRKARLAGKAAIGAAGSIETAAAAFDAVAWPTLG